MDTHQQNNHTKPNSSKPTLSPDLMSSAKILAEAAKSAFAHETVKIDKAKVAGATADILGAAKHYGKLEEKSFGKYVDKAETYLHSYHSSSSSSAASTAAPAASNADHHGGGGGKHGQGGSGGGGGGGSGAGDYIKLAQGLLKKGDHGGSGDGGGGSGEYIKLAQGLFKKH